MITFRAFLENEENDDIKTTLSKLPKSHRNLVQGFSIELHGGNTLKGDDEHVGYMDKGPKEIAVAAPWNYGREFTFLHEIAHRVWEKLPDEIRNAWARVAQAKSKHEIEEQFCMSYAAAYSEVPPAKHYNKEQINFIKNLPC